MWAFFLFYFHRLNFNDKTFKMYWSWIRGSNISNPVLRPKKGRWPPFKMATTQGNKRQTERKGKEGRMGRKYKTSILWDLKPHE